MQSGISKFTRIGTLAAALALAHCAGNGASGVDAQTTAAALARVQPLVKSAAAYGQTLSVAGSGASTAMGMQAANTLAGAVVPGTRLPVHKVARAVKRLRDAAAVPDNNLEAFLNSRMFVAGNIESISGTTTTYLLHGDTLCANAAGDPNAAGDDCANRVDSMAVRLVVTTSGQNQDIQVQVGSGTRVATVSFDAASQAIATDLDSGKIQAVLAGLGSFNPNDVTMSGHLTVDLTRASANQASIVVGFPDAITLNLTGNGRSISLGAAPQALTLAANDTLWSAACALGSVDVASPLTGNDGNSTTTLKGHLAGLTWQVQGDASSQGAFTVTGLGIGNAPVTLTRADTEQTLLGVQMNADANGTVELTVGAPDANYAQAVSVSPYLKIDATAAMASIAPSLGVSQPWYDNQYSVVLSNNGNPATISLLDGDFVGLTNGSLQVVQGSLVLKSTQAGVTVPTGQCLGAADEATPGPTWVTDYQAVSCDSNP